MLTIFVLVILFFSVVIHEIAHGSVALHLGDPTAKNAGRLTLNPIKHIDLFGTIILPIMLLIFTQGRGPIIGWAKPVPINPFNFKDQKWGGLKVGVAGSTMNFLVAIIFGLSVRLLPLPESLVALFNIVVLYNFAWGLFNLFPVPPFDGSHILFALIPEKFNQIKLFLHKYGLFIIILFIFWGLQWLFTAAAALSSLVIGRHFIF